MGDFKANADGPRLPNSGTAGQLHPAQGQVSAKCRWKTQNSKGDEKHSPGVRAFALTGPVVICDLEKVHVQTPHDLVSPGQEKSGRKHDGDGGNEAQVSSRYCRAVSQHMCPSCACMALTTESCPPPRALPLPCLSLPQDLLLILLGPSTQKPCTKGVPSQLVASPPESSCCISLRFCVCTWVSPSNRDPMWAGSTSSSRWMPVYPALSTGPGAEWLFPGSWLEEEKERNERWH